MRGARIIGRPAHCRCPVLSVFHVLFDRLSMCGYVIAAGRFTAPSTLQVVGGIQGPAPRTGVVFPHFREPLFVPDRPDSFKVDPQFDPVRHCSLEPFQVIAGIVFAFTAKVDTPFSGTRRHRAFLTIGQPLVRTASIAPARFF